MKFDPSPVIWSPRKYRQIYFDPLVTVLKGFHCISFLLYFAEYLKSNNYIHKIFSCQALLFFASIVKRKLPETLRLVFVHFRSARLGTLAFKLLHVGNSLKASFVVFQSARTEKLREFETATGKENL